MGDFQRGYGDFPEFDGPTISAGRLPPDCPVPVRLNVTRSLAEAMARRAFWRGVVFGGLIIGATFIAGAAVSLDIAGSTVTLEASTDPRAVADVVFVNDLSNGPTDTGAYTLSEGGLVVGVSFTWDANFIGMDRVVVTPPVGMVCVPAACTMVVIEGQVGRVALLPYVGF